jgi:hypothetical protein
MKEIGGYFELEQKKGVYHYHDTPYAMKSGRSSLNYILNTIKPALVHIPYYTCDALLEPFATSGIKYQFYHINEQLEPATLIDLKPGEFFLYINYQDLKRNTVATLSNQYKDKLIVDCTQAFFMKGNGMSWYFNSCRKFFGVPDGSYLYTPLGAELPVITERNEGYIIDHLLKRLNGHTQEGYEFFLQNETLADSTVIGMSKLTEYLLSGVNYEEIIEKRRTNYAFLHERLKGINGYDATLGFDNVPLSYPLVLDATIGKEALFAANIFIPSFWADVKERQTENFETEKKITDRSWPLPVDHRYSIADMEVVCKAITGILS